MTRPKIACSALHIEKELTLFHVGPSLDHGPLPTVFYFSLSGEDSLTKDPFNQPVQFLADHPLHIFSLDLPGHEAHLDPKAAPSLWIEDLLKGKNPFEEFVEKAQKALNYLIENQITHPEKIAVSGLSRGAFFAALFAALQEKIRHLLLYAPLIALNTLQECQSVTSHPLIKNLDLRNFSKELYDRHLRMYVGNHDERIGTKTVFSFLETIVSTGIKTTGKPPQTELIITPSIGHKGHGTSMETFYQGAKFLADTLLSGSS